MYLTTLLLLTLPFAATTPISTPSFSVQASCAAPNSSTCAQFLFANGTVSQDIHIDDSGCTDVAHSDIIAGIKVFDCWCGLWNAATAGACNNGNDEVVDQIDSCAGVVDGKKWKLRPTHVSCFRI